MVLFGTIGVVLGGLNRISSLSMFLLCCQSSGNDAILFTWMRSGSGLNRAIDSCKSIIVSTNTFIYKLHIQTTSLLHAHHWLTIEGLRSIKDTEFVRTGSFTPALKSHLLIFKVISSSYVVKKIFLKWGSELLETINTKYLFLQQGGKSAQHIRKLTQSCLSSKNYTFMSSTMRSLATQGYETFSKTRLGQKLK